MKNYEMPDYQQGKVYKIISDSTDKIYIGSTTNQYLSNRMALHRQQFRFWKEGQIKKHTSSIKILKFANAKIVLIENYPCKSKEELLACEQKWIDYYKDICVNKYSPKYRPSKEYHQKYYQDNIEEHKKQGKIWYQKNHNNILKKMAIPKLCLYCDKTMRSGDYTRHCKSQLHQSQVKFFEKILK